MRTFVAIGLLLLSAAPVSALSLPQSLLEDLRKTGRVQEAADLLASARDRGVADRARCASERLGPGYNLRGRLPERLLVLLVDFADHPAGRTTFTREWYRRLLFGIGESATGSLRDYYREISYGDYDVNGVIAGWYTLPQSLAFYTAGSSGLGEYPRNGQRLAEDALRAADQDVNFAHFDNDGPDGLPDSGDDDGFVDAVLVVHAGPAAETTGSRGDLWSHQWVIHEPIALDGVRAALYFTVAEDARIGVACHEFGHILGLEDLFDTDFDGAGLGLWSLMAYGASSAAGLRPPHPDAWSRLKLGFVTAIAPSGNLESVSIPPVETAPIIYKLWTNGAPSQEYFLVENRRRIGFDTSLPGEGLLIYHVDERVPSNLDEDHYRVAIEQSDGERHLEHGFWFGNLGDTGDAYPGVQRRTEFSVATFPASRAYNETRSAVAVRNIRVSGSWATADLHSFPAAAVQPKAVVVEDTDEDGCLSAGETARLAVLARNAGEAGGAWRLEMASLSPALAIEPVEADVPAMAAGPVEARSGWIAARAGEGTTGPANVRVVLTEAGVTVADEIFAVWIGPAPSRLEDLDDAGGWRNDPEGEPALWERADGHEAWRLRGSYGSHAEGSLVSPVFPARPGAVVRFAYRSALPGAEGLAPDGVEIEGSLNGSAWTPLVPVAAVEYPVPANPATPLGGRLALADTTQGWASAIFALGGGGAWSVRFRFGSDAVVNGGTFEVDSLSAGTALTPLAPRATCRRGGGAVRLAVEVEDGSAYAGAAFLRSEDGAAYARLHEGWIGLGSGRAEFEDRRAGRPARYRIDLLRRSGEIETLGPLTPEGVTASRLALVSANPFEGAVRLAYEVPAGAGPYTIRVFDASGRRIAEIASGGDTAGETVHCAWDGRDGRGPAAAGLYFMRLEHAGGAQTVRAVRLP